MNALRRDYHILTPVSTHFRPATCAEVNCPDFERGWKVRLPWGDEERLGILQASGRKYVEVPTDGAEREFVFSAGQSCFKASQHRVNLERPAIHIVRDGHAQPQKMSAQGWHDNLGEHLAKIRELQERG